MNELNILKRATIEGKNIILPSMDLEQKDLIRIKSKVNRIGGRWKEKINGFVFKIDPTNLLKDVLSGKSFEINLAQQDLQENIQSGLADKMIHKAEIFHDDKILILDTSSTLLIGAVHKVFPEINVDFSEVDSRQNNAPVSFTNISKLGDQIFDYLPGEVYDIIIAKPSLLKGIDIDYVSHLYKLLRPGGRMVTIITTYWETEEQNQKLKRFAIWLNERKRTVEYLPSKAIVSRTVHIPACVLTIDKPVHGSKI